MNPQLKKGVLELCVLSQLTKEDKYGYELTDAISREMSIAAGTLYMILKRLKEAGYVETYLQESYKIVIIMQLYLSRKKCYSENNTDTKAERGAKSIRRKKGGNKMEFVFEHATMIAVIAVVVIILAILASGYVKAPPDTAFIISGFKKGQRILIGKAGIKLPFFERLDKLSLKLVAIDVKTSDAVPTADYINIQVDAAVNIKVGDEPQKLQKASQNFLNRDSEYIAKVAREVLEGNMREIVGKMRLEEMVSDRQKFAELVKENAEPDLAAMGLDIISFNVQNFVDSNQVIENLGIDNIVKIKKSAAIARANSEKEIKIAQARANKEANDERVLAETEIAKKNNDLAIKSAELKKESDIKKAEADAAYKIQEEQQRKELEITSANANIARQEREVELRAREVEVTEKSLEAEVKKKAEAERYAKQQQAEADLYRRQKDAEADQFEKIREAEAKKAQAEAQRYAMEQEALGIKAKGEAEAASIRAQALAEAEGMEKKAEAYQRYNKAAMAEMMIKVLPEIAGKIAEPLSQIDKITIIGGGSEDNGIGSVAGNVPVVMAKLFESMKEATGVDLSEIMRADTYDAKVNRNIQISSPEELKEYLKAEAGKAAADAESPERAEASEPVQKDGSEQ
jgi:flotillin